MRILAQCHKRALVRAGQAPDAAVKAALDLLAQRIALRGLDLLAQDGDDIFYEAGVQVATLLQGMVSHSATIPFLFCACVGLCWFAVGCVAEEPSAVTSLRERPARRLAQYDASWGKAKQRRQ